IEPSPHLTESDHALPNPALPSLAEPNLTLPHLTPPNPAEPCRAALCPTRPCRTSPCLTIPDRPLPCPTAQSPEGSGVSPARSPLADAVLVASEKKQRGQRVFSEHVIPDAQRSGGPPRLADRPHANGFV